MRRFIPTALGFAALVAVAACSQKSSPVDDALSRDLERAGASEIELRPSNAGQVVVSDVEQLPRGKAAAPVQRRKVPRPAPRRTPQPVAVAHTEAPDVTRDPAPTPEPAAESDEPAMSRPTSRPAVSPAPRGGYKSVGEIIRNAPFPINP